MGLGGMFLLKQIVAARVSNGIRVIFRYSCIVWKCSFGSSRLIIFACDLSIGTFSLDRSFRSIRLESPLGYVVWELSLMYFRLGLFAWEFSRGICRLGTWFAGAAFWSNSDVEGWGTV